jgi:hypothetical protein
MDQTDDNFRPQNLKLIYQAHESELLKIWYNQRLSLEERRLEMCRTADQLSGYS